MSLSGTNQTSRQVRDLDAVGGGGKQTWRGRTKIDADDPTLPFVSISCRGSEVHFDPFLTCEPTDVVAPIHPKAMPVTFSVSPGAKCQVTLALMAQANAELESLLA
jgi:hypothetical protein